MDDDEVSIIIGEGPPAYVAHAYPLRLYRPSNGTEGEIFDEVFCGKCVHDRHYRETEESGRGEHQQNPDGSIGCSILARALACGINEPEFPKEWCYVLETDAEAGLVEVAVCTAFTEHEPIERCKFTIDMFPQGETQ